MADQLHPVPLVTPGFKGLNKTQSSVPDLDPGWAIECQNFIFDQTGRLASRQGWTQQTVTPLSAGTIGVLVAPAPGDTGATKLGVWANPTGFYMLVFSSGELRPSFLTNGSAAISWQTPLTQAATTSITTRPIIQAMAELAKADGTTFIVSAAQNKLYSGTTTLTDITGSLTPTGNNWQFFTFFGALYGVQAGNPLIKWTGAGNFTTITPSSGTVPTGGSCGCAAFGRLWILNSDNQTISYCNLGDDTAWSVAGAGSINMATVWTRGIDQVIGIAAAGSKLVIFGTKQIVLYFDTAGAVIGLNPANLAVYDTIEGTGLAARDTIQSTAEGDLTFLSPTGVQSLSRLLSSGKDNPVLALDPQIRDYFNAFFSTETPATIRSAYSPSNRFYLILLPNAQRVFCYDTRVKLPDGSLRVTEWPSITWQSMTNTKAGAVYLGEGGLVGLYGGYADNLKSYNLVYNSPFLALKSIDGESFENRMKVLKRMKAVLYFGGTSVATFLWGVDFNGLTASQQVNLGGILSEYGIAQYNINEYGGGAGLQVLAFPLSLSGRWLQFGFTSSINGYQVAIQQMDAFAKIGNMV